MTTDQVLEMIGGILIVGTLCVMFHRVRNGPILAFVIKLIRSIELDLNTKLK